MGKCNNMSTQVTKIISWMCLRGEGPVHVKLKTSAANGPALALLPIDPVPSMMAVTVAKALEFPLRHSWVP